MSWLPYRVFLVSGGSRLSESGEDLVESARLVVSTGPSALSDPTSRALAARHADKLLRLDARSVRQWPAQLECVRRVGLVDVQHRRPTPERIVLDVEATRRPAMIFVSEGHHPWWRATVDGKPAPLLRAQTAFMAVPVGPGPHAIELRFVPPRLVRLADWTTRWAWLVLAAAAPLSWLVGRLRAHRTRSRPSDQTEG